jgi:hypothetical protein
MFWTIVIGQALISAVLCGVIADSKNRDAGGWAALGFLFGLFALIAAVGVAPLVKAPQPEEVNSKDSTLPETTPFSGERTLANDAYKLWLAAHYRIERNEIFDSFVVRDHIFPELEAALGYAHAQEIAAIEAAEAAAIEKAGLEEQERQLREQRSAQAAAEAAEDRRKFWRREIWIIAAIVLFSGGGLYASLQYQDRKKEEKENNIIINKLFVEQALKNFGLPSYEFATEHDPNGNLDIYCREWQSKKPSVVIFNAAAVSSFLDSYYDEAAINGGYKKSPSLSGWIYRRADGRAFIIKTTPKSGVTEVAFCLVEESNATE